MPAFSRRAFLGASFAGLTTSYLNGSPHLGMGSVPHSKSPAILPSDTLFLTWQHDPLTTMTVQWVGPPMNPADTIISYAPALNKGSVWSVKSPSVSPYPMTDLLVHRAELVGLVPGTDYQFRIGHDTKTHSFRTMPAKATDSIHFVSGGDCGTDAHAVANNIMAARQDPMFAVIGGDLAYEDGHSAETHLAFLRNYSRHMIGQNDRMIPMVACIGNHEVEGGWHAPRSKAPFFYAMFGGLFRETGYATLDFGDYLSLVLLDTDHTTPVAGEQTDWLEARLKERMHRPHVFVVNHVPAYPSARDMEGTGDSNRKHWVPLFEKYRVPAVLEHHDHTFKRSKALLGGLAHANGVLYLGDGSWGKLRALNKPEKLSHLAVTNQDYHLSFHRLEGEQRFHLALAESGRVLDICSSGQRRLGLMRAGG